MQTDPIGYGDGMNWYAYVGNDPVNGVDPTGMSTDCGCESIPPPPPIPNHVKGDGSSGDDRRDRDGDLVFTKKTESEITTNSAGEDVEREFVEDHDELLDEANAEADGSLDNFDNYKPDWWQSEDKTKRIEWNPDGHANTNEGPHVTVRKFNGRRHGVKRKIFIKGQEKYQK